jgi:hypothetical protein
MTDLFVEKHNVGISMHRTNRSNLLASIEAVFTQCVNANVEQRLFNEPKRKQDDKNTSWTCAM